MNIKIPILVFLAACIAISSCKSSGDIAPIVKSSNLDVVNATTDSLNFYQNGTRLFNLSSISPNGSTGYFAVPVTIPLTAENYEFKKAGSTDYLITNYQLKLDTVTYYSLFAAGETADKLFLITDVAPTVTAGQAAIRFVNASPGTVSLSATVGATSFSSQAFKSASAFIGVTAGLTTITIYQAGSSTALYTTSVTLLTGTIYTLFTRGVVGGTGANKLSSAIIIN